MKIRETKIERKLLTKEQHFANVVRKDARNVLDKGLATTYLRDKGMIIESYDGSKADFEVVIEREMTFEEQRAYHYLEMRKLCYSIRAEKGVTLQQDVGVTRIWCPAGCDCCMISPVNNVWAEKVMENKEVIL